MISWPYLLLIIPGALLGLLALRALTDWKRPGQADMDDFYTHRREQWARLHARKRNRQRR